MRRLPALLLIGALAVGGLTACMGDDEGSAREERRAGALDPTETDPGDPGGITPSSAPKLTLTVFSGLWGTSIGRRVVAEGSVGQDSVVNGRRLSPPLPTKCGSARSDEPHKWETGNTCTWQYERNPCPAYLGNCTIVVDLMVYRTPAGDDTRIELTGCALLSAAPWPESPVCRVTLDHDRSMTARFEDPTPFAG